MLKQRLQQKLLQKLSPQQIQLIKLLEVPTLQLEQRIKKEIEENPALEDETIESENFEEENNSENEDENTNTEDEFSLEDYLPDDDEIPNYKLQTNNYSKDDERKDIPFSSGSTFHEHLYTQLGLRSLSEKEVALSEYIIGNIDDDGYLRRRLDAIADDIAFTTGVQTNEDELDKLLMIIQDFDPAGVGAQDLQECLLIQIERKDDKKLEIELARKIIRHHFNEFTKKHYEKIISRLNINEDLLKEAINEILKLNPRPGSSFNDPGNRASQPIIPDFMLDIEDGEFQLSLNSRNLPELRVSKTYADRTGLDISTISRVANSKYIQTHFGIFALKHFFSESMQTYDGEEVSTREIKQILSECIDGEDKKRPLTDEKLTQILQKKGYRIARRTVAKYREQLNISVARLRKEI
jgi:RNA polymerase sigma-54 factor